MSDHLDTIENLIKFMESYGLTELQVKQGEMEFKARRGNRADPPFVFQPQHAIVHQPDASASGSIVTRVDDLAFTSQP